MWHKLKSPFILIPVYSIILLSVNFFWIKTYNPHPINPDQSLNLLENLRYYNLLRQMDIKNLRKVFKAESLYPPFYGLLGAFFNLAFGYSSLISILFTNTFCFLILLISVYLIGKKLFDKRTGIFSIIFLCSFPLLIASTRWFYHEFALTAIVSLSILCLIQTDNFKRLIPSLFFGFLIFIGLLTKWTYLLFLSGPLLIELHFLLKTRDRKKRLFNFCISISIGILLALMLWYLPNFSILYPGIRQGQIRISLIDVKVTSLKGILFYIKSLPFHINPFNSLLLVVFFLPFASKISRREHLILITWLLIPLIGLTFLPNKWSCYLMPSIPAISLILAGGLLSLKDDRYLYKLCLAYNLCLFFYLTIYQLKPFRALEADYLKFNWFSPPSYECKLANTIKAIINGIKKADFYKDLDKELKIGIIDTIPWLMTSISFKYASRELNLNAKVFEYPRLVDEFEPNLGSLDILIFVRNRKGIIPSDEEIERLIIFEKLNIITGIGLKRYKGIIKQLEESLSNFTIYSTYKIKGKLWPWEDYFYIYVLVAKKLFE